MAFLPIIVLPIRITQAIFSIIVLSVLSYAASDWYWSWTPSQISFLIFVAAWTLLALVYLVFAPLNFQQYAHKWAVLTVEALTMLFWFAGFVALASWLSWTNGCGNLGPCQASVAGDVFAAFTWALFCITTFMALHHAWNSRGDGNKPAPAVGMQGV